MATGIRHVHPVCRSMEYFASACEGRLCFRRGRTGGWGGDSEIECPLRMYMSKGCYEYSVETTFSAPAWPMMRFDNVGEYRGETLALATRMKMRSLAMASLTEEM